MSESTATTDWESRLATLMPFFGHRNWIVVADSAYPAQSRVGIETIVAAADQIALLRKVVSVIVGSGHIRANVYLDRELDFVLERDAPGIASYRRELEALLDGSDVSRVPHEKKIDKLDQSAQLFRILIIKTKMTIPYTSVFFELDCGYWHAEAEQRLRQSMLQAEMR